MLWSNVTCQASSNENVWKYVFEQESAVAEAVLYRYPTFEQRTVICCSTQSGCPVGCRFCGAGDSFVRSLSAREIVEQVQHLLQDKSIEPARIERFQIMFMSMGEPLLNQKALVPAIQELHRLYPTAKLLISTSAPKVDLSAVIAVSREISEVGLQFSVHESTDAARNALVPFKQKMTLAEIADAGQAWFRATGRRPFFNYCVHERNSSDEDADRLVALFSPDTWECTISVICERAEFVAAANERQRDLSHDFSSKMLSRGYSVRVFDPAGQDDIGGGCGQLWFVQKWMQEHPNAVRASAGRGLPIVHTPHSLA